MRRWDTWSRHGGWLVEQCWKEHIQDGMNENWYPLSGFFHQYYKRISRFLAVTVLGFRFSEILRFLVEDLWARFFWPGTPWGGGRLRESGANTQPDAGANGRLAPFARNRVFPLNWVVLCGDPDPLFSDQYLRQRDRRASEQPKFVSFGAFIVAPVQYNQNWREIVVEPLNMLHAIML